MEAKRFSLYMGRILSSRLLLQTFERAKEENISLFKTTDVITFKYKFLTLKQFYFCKQLLDICVSLFNNCCPLYAVNDLLVD